MNINWTDPNCQVSEHFTVKDCLWLHAWGRLATAEDGADFDKIVVLCQKLEQIRTVLGAPMRVHCIFRSKEYNIEQGILLPTGADIHSFSEAADFDCLPHLTIEQVQEKLEPLLEQLNIRMERNTPTWIHCDVHKVGNARYFYP